MAKTVNIIKKIKSFSGDESTINIFNITNIRASLTFVDLFLKISIQFFICKIYTPSKGKIC